MAVRTLLVSAKGFLPIAVLFLLGLVLFLTSPVSGDFSWSDAPRHALNGIFVLDLLRAMPLEDPGGWAERYYLQYPALSILFYPPLFSLLLALAYAVFGFSHAVAQGLVAVFHFALMAGMFVLLRRWVFPLAALAGAVMLGFAPEVAFWGRQVMLDIPAYAWLIWSVVAFFAYVDHRKPAMLFVGAGLFLCALYTKQTAIFAALPLLLLLVMACGWRWLLERHVLIAAGFFAVGLMPLVVLQLTFGAVNAESVLGGERADAGRLTLQAWSYYLSVLPSQLGWPVLLLAVAWAIPASAMPAWRLSGRDLAFLVSWLLFGYVFFSLIMVREPRHDLMALWPLVAFASLAIDRLAATLRETRIAFVAMVVALGAGLASVGYATLLRPPHFVDGYGELAAYVVERTPPDSYVLFSGYRDGNFVYAVRAHERKDVGVLRADKLLLSVAIERERGVDVKEYSRDELLAELRRYRVRYVVAEEGFWEDLPSMALLTGLLHDESLFEQELVVAPSANYPNTDQRVGIWRFLPEIDEQRAALTIELRGVGMTFSEERAVNSTNENEVQP